MKGQQGQEAVAIDIKNILVFLLVVLLLLILIGLLTKQGRTLIGEKLMQLLFRRG